MITRGDIPAHKEVQAKAKRVLFAIWDLLSPGMSEADIAALCIDLLRAEGVNETWYYDVPAFVLAGNRTVLSMSGRDYEPAKDVKLVAGDLVTIDLSPSVNGKWGDCARSFCVGSHPPPRAMQEGMEVEIHLHRELISWARPSKSFGDLFTYMNRKIDELGYENLDFAYNLGHSIEASPPDRIYIEAGNHRMLADVTLFTFEPHIRRPGSSLGFKHENIYHFDETGHLIEL